MKLKFFAFIATLIFSHISFGCIYNGTTYPPGTKVGGLICQGDGTWK